MENKLATHRRSVLHYLRPVTALEDYTSITRLNFKLSVYPLASNRQPFAGYSMVLQSVTRAVTRATARRRGCFFSKSGLRFSFCPPSSFLLFHAPHVESILLWSLLIDGFLFIWKRSFIKEKVSFEIFTLKKLQKYRVTWNRKNFQHFVRSNRNIFNKVLF